MLLSSIMKVWNQVVYDLIMLSYFSLHFKCTCQWVSDHFTTWKFIKWTTYTCMSLRQQSQFQSNDIYLILTKEHFIFWWEKGIRWFLQVMVFNHVIYKFFTCTILLKITNERKPNRRNEQDLNTHLLTKFCMTLALSFWEFKAWM